MSWLPVDKRAIVERNWRDQYERVLRWRKRLDSAKPAGDLNPTKLETYHDFAHAFFINCFHLKDWLVDASRPETMIDAFINENPCLAACRGICHAAKHFKLTRVSKGVHYREYLTTTEGVAVSSSTGFSGEVTDWAPAGSQPGDYFVETPLGDFEVQALADDCLAAWGVFLTQNGLEPPMNA